MSISYDRSEPTPLTTGSSRSFRAAADASVRPCAAVTWRASWIEAAYSTSARMPSAYAFCSISIRRTSG